LLEIKIAPNELYGLQGQIKALRVLEDDVQQWFEALQEVVN